MSRQRAAGQIVSGIAAGLFLAGAAWGQTPTTAALQRALANRPSAQTPPPPPVFFRTLLDRLKDKPDPENKAANERYQQQLDNLIPLIEAAPYVFRPTEAEKKELLAAGASESLMEALQKAQLDVNDRDESGLSLVDRQLIKQLGEKNVEVRARAALAIANREVHAAVPALAVLIASDLWETGGSISPPGGLGEPEFFLFTDVSRELALETLLLFDRQAAERALLKAMESSEMRVRQWATAAMLKLHDVPPPPKPALDVE